MDILPLYDKVTYESQKLVEGSLRKRGVSPNAYNHGLYRMSDWGFNAVILLYLYIHFLSRRHYFLYLNFIWIFM